MLRAPIDRAAGPFRVGVIGDPVAHSLSPALHQSALDELGIPARYERWHTPADMLEARFATLRETDVLGANVTVPHKLAALEAADELTSAARRAGAVNTLVNIDGRLLGENTDIDGFAAALREVGAEVDVALVLGAGGAARAVALALEAVGARTILVSNRHAERAATLADDLAPAPITAMGDGDDELAAALPEADLLVNATSLGWHPGELPIAAWLLSLLPDHALVVDLTYRQTDMLAAAEARSLRTLDGLPMLVYQGARAFEHFTGMPAPVATMLAAAQRAQRGG